MTFKLKHLESEWEKIAGGRKSNVPDKTLCFFEGWQNSPMVFLLFHKLIFTFQSLVK